MAQASPTHNGASSTHYMAAMDPSDTRSMPADFMASLGMSSLGRQHPQTGSDINLTPVQNGLPEQSNILRFYTSSEDPWTPPNLVKPSSNAPSQSVLNVPGPQRYYQNACNFSEYRSAGQPSESGTFPGDSGYGGSGPPCSVESASIIHEDDRGFDSQIMDYIGTFHLGTDSQHSQTAGHKHYCEDCKTSLKTMSELNKHRQRHRKPHRCSYQNCSRAKEGFSTSNDLQRHKRTVHNEDELGGKKYICPHGNCQNKPLKKWPRADNFRSHLVRVHNKEIKSDSDLARYIYSPPSMQPDNDVVMTTAFVDCESRPNNFPEALDTPRDQIVTQSLQSQGGTRQSSSEESDQISLNGYLQTPHSADKNDDASLCDDQMQYIQPEVLQGPGTQMQNQAEASFLEDLRQTEHGNDTNLLGLDGDMGSLTDTDTQETSDISYEDAESPATPTKQTEDTAPQPCTLDDESKRPLLAGFNPTLAADTPRVLEFLKSLPKELLQNALKTEAVGTSSTKMQNQCPTPKCGKHFNRPCELKKHMKRHQKPYGCTFPHCTKTFGSKNDWKRHESSQHFQLETWNCNEPNCGKICQRRESFRSHLNKDHSMTDSTIVEEKLDTCRVGRHCGTRFWCGFCLKEVEIQPEGVNWWTKRCDHIDSHLFGKGLEKKHIGEWINPEDLVEQATRAGDAQQQQVVADTNKAASRKRKIGETSRQPSKRPTRFNIYMWTCCQCHDVMNLKTSRCCFNCSHQKCDHDLVEEVREPSEEKEGKEEVDVPQSERTLPPVLADFGSSHD